MPVAQYAAEQLDRSTTHLKREWQIRVGRVRGFLVLSTSDPRAAFLVVRAKTFSTILSPLTILVLIWMWALCWGEIWSFDNAIKDCDWGHWEDWPVGATPHHIALVADPQLVDPHTYPGRSHLLNTLTFKHTDLYMRRSYSRIQRNLDPNTIFFLGDLFDGGREWSTPTSQSPEFQYRQYGDEYWLREFDRFSAIFLREWKDDKLQLSQHNREGRRIIASLPGNHDLGWARGIRKPVRDRFASFFGDGNRIDVIANHTFISMDTPSLSAAEQPAAPQYEAIWGPPQDFLNTVKTKRYQAIADYLDHQYGTSNQITVEDQKVYDIETTEFPERSEQSPPQFELPTIFFSHVPFYRNVGEPCGPLRERRPPTPPPEGKPGPVYPDEPNAITVIAGYQYQNVLSDQISSLIAQKLDGAIEYVFSGDDHDYCEVVHTNYAHRGSGIREITVKSISEAMGVRKPGFLLVSLWNPINNRGEPLASASGKERKTLQTKLCLLPDIVSIVIRYALLLGISLAALLLRAVWIASVQSRFFDSPVLPVFSTPAKAEKAAPNGFSNVSQPHNHTHSQSFASTSSADENSSHLSSRNPSKTRSMSPLRLSDLPTATSYALKPDQHEKSRPYYNPVMDRRYLPQRLIRMILYEWALGIWSVAWIVIVWYLILWQR